jgi:hypothetical protein
MPSPVGHALAGIATGWLVDPPHPHEPRGAATRAAVYALAAMAADVDLLFGAHSGPTHGLGTAAILGVMVWIWTTRLRASQPEGASRGAPGSATRGRSAGGGGRFALAVAAAYASHTLLDWLGSDTSPPIGIMALWPVSRDYYESTLHVFMAISRRYWLPEFWTYNMRALLRELVILGPLVAAAILFRRTAGRA